MAVAVGPVPELLDDPRALRRRRVDQPVAEGLRARRLLGRVPRAPPAVVGARLERRLLRLREIRPSSRVVATRGAAARGCRRRAPRPAGRAGGHERTPVAALRAVPVVAEPRHQLRPGAGDALHVPPGRASACRSSRSRGATGTPRGTRRAASPPCAAGSASGPITFWNSTTDPGQPWVSDQRQCVGVRRARRARSGCRARRSRCGTAGTR